MAPRTSKNYALTSVEMLDGLCGEANLMSYIDTTKLDDVLEVLGPYKQCVILYEIEKNFGHWCCLFLRDNGDIEFFDSYGFIMDDELDFGKGYYNEELGPEYDRKGNKIRLPHISYLIYKYAQANPSVSIIYSEYHLQSKRNNISTCGRWVLSRLWLKDMDIDDFAYLFKNSQYKTPDDFVTDYTNDMLGLYDIDEKDPIKCPAETVVELLEKAKKIGTYMIHPNVG